MSTTPARVISLPPLRSLPPDPFAAVEQARVLLSATSSVDHAKQIADQGSALELLLRRRKSGLDAARCAAEIVIRARRRIGELTLAMPVAAGGRPARGETRPALGKFHELEALGLTRAEVSRCEQLARIDAAALEAYISGIGERTERITVGGALSALSGAEDYDGDEWHTARRLIPIFRSLLGGIDCDPATNPAAQAMIRARVFYTAKTNGLDPRHRWRGRVFCNPPYSAGKIAAFAAKWIEEHRRGALRAGVLLVNNQTDAQWFQDLIALYPFLVMRGRNHYEYRGRAVAKNSARQGQILILTGIPVAKARPWAKAHQLGVVCSAA